MKPKQKKLITDYVSAQMIRIIISKGKQDGKSRLAVVRQLLKKARENKEFVDNIDKYI
jgi:hypothetical protein